MQTKLVEVTQPGDGMARNWGRFLVMRPDHEWQRRSVVADSSRPLLATNGWGPKHVIVFDLVTFEGAAFNPGGVARADLNKHRIWVCVLYEAFLAWLYTQDLTDLAALPDVVELDAPFDLAGYRRPGPELDEALELLGSLDVMGSYTDGSGYIGSELQRQTTEFLTRHGRHAANNACVHPGLDPAECPRCVERRQRKESAP